MEIASEAPENNSFFHCLARKFHFPTHLTLGGRGPSSLWYSESHANFPPLSLMNLCNKRHA